MDDSLFPKLSRAQKLYEEIHEAGQLILNHEVEYEVHEYGVYPDHADVLIWRRTPSAHPELAVIAGELVHDVRSTLDQLVCDLIRERGGSNCGRTSFPVISSEEEWERRVSRGGLDRGQCGECGRGPVRNPLHGLVENQVAYIKSVQPLNLNSGQQTTHPLFVLQRFSNQDKHRSLVTCAVRVRNPESVTYEPAGFYEAIEIDFGKGFDLVEVGKEFGRVKRIVLNEPEARLGVRIRVMGQAQLAFQADGELPIATIQDLGEAINFVAQICQDLSPNSTTRTILI